MKKTIISILSILTIVLVASSCNKENKAPVDISGQWHLTSSDKVDITAEGIDVYIEFFAAGRFELYQKIGSGEYRYFSGNYTTDGNAVSGSYSDGTPWGASYEATVSGGTLTMTSKNEAAETCIYSSAAIPSSVSSDAVLFSTKSFGPTPLSYPL